MLSTARNDELYWFHGPANFNDLPNMVVNLGEFFEVLVGDQAGVPPATCVTRLTRHWLGNATGWFVEVQYVGCSDPLFGQNSCSDASSHRYRCVTHMFERFVDVLHSGYLAGS